jgi:hypothetical protein
MEKQRPIQVNDINNADSPMSYLAETVRAYQEMEETYISERQEAVVAIKQQQEKE